MMICIDYNTLAVTVPPAGAPLRSLTLVAGDTIPLEIAVMEGRVAVKPADGSMPVLTIKQTADDAEALVLINEWMLAETRLGKAYSAPLCLDTPRIREIMCSSTRMTVLAEIMLQGADETQRSSSIIPVTIAADLNRGNESPPAPAIPQWREDVEAVRAGAISAAESCEAASIARDEAAESARTTVNARDDAAQWSEEAKGHAQSAADEAQTGVDAVRAQGAVSIGEVRAEGENQVQMAQAEAANAGAMASNAAMAASMAKVSENNATDSAISAANASSVACAAANDAEQSSQMATGAVTEASMFAEQSASNASLAAGKASEAVSSAMAAKSEADRAATVLAGAVSKSGNNVLSGNNLHDGSEVFNGPVALNGDVFVSRAPSSQQQVVNLGAALGLSCGIFPFRSSHPVLSFPSQARVFGESVHVFEDRFAGYLDFAWSMVGPTRSLIYENIGGVFFPFEFSDNCWAPKKVSFGNVPFVENGDAEGYDSGVLAYAKFSVEVFVLEKVGEFRCRVRFTEGHEAVLYEDEVVVTLPRRGTSWLGFAYAQPRHQWNTSIHNSGIYMIGHCNGSYVSLKLFDVPTFDTISSSLTTAYIRVWSDRLLRFSLRPVLFYFASESESVAAPLYSFCEMFKIN